MLCFRCNQPEHDDRTCGITPKLEHPPASTDYMQETPSKNSLVAKSGFSAEDLICKSREATQALVNYFGKPIKEIQKIGGRKKADNLIVFEDGTSVRFQLKNGTGGGRGWSFDRRNVDDLPTMNDAIKCLAKAVCLKNGERCVAANDKQMITTLLLGTDASSAPQFVVHTHVVDEKIVELSICTAEAFVEAVLKDAYEFCMAKRTCVHLTPLIYFQRKAGGSADKRPDDIQCKLKKMPDCITKLPLTQTTSAPQEQTPE